VFGFKLKFFSFKTESLITSRECAYCQKLSDVFSRTQHFASVKGRNTIINNVNNVKENQITILITFPEKNSQKTFFRPQSRIDP